MIDKWNKLRILIQWLEQGRVLDIDNVTYGLSEDGDILHMFSEDRGIPLPSLTHIWKLIEKIDEYKFFSMSSEVALTNMNKHQGSLME